MATLKRTSLSKKDYELLAEFRYTLRKFLRFSEQAAVKHDVTPQQYQALLAIEGYRGRNFVTMGELAEQLQIAPHSTVGLVDRMEKIGLLCRRSAAEDGRMVVVALTTQGLSVLETLYRVHRKELRSVGPQLTKLLREAAQKMPSEIGEA